MGAGIVLRPTGGRYQLEYAERRDTWRDFAACHGTDPEVFFTASSEDEERLTPRSLADIELAKQVCARCPVRQACLDDILAEEGEATWGVRGGMAAHERRTMLRRERKNRNARELAAAKKAARQEQAAREEQAA